ncbi:unnamed protein product [Symbiodinium natans]|uniref:Uncharacterized protein n=1 Tax=Symbiodinium natans TaxID=878477 RepID=A0A812LJR5_9DINO|nr:unnamed protein product [Symbiodinium natans]
MPVVGNSHSQFTGALTGSVEVRGRLAGGETWSFAVDLGALNAVEVPAVRLLWARSRIAVLSDYAAVAVLSDYAAVAQSHDALESEITRLGLQYSLMTTYTSFVAVDSQASRPDMCTEVGSGYGYGYGYGDGWPPPSRAFHSEPPLVMMLAALLFGPGWL